MSWLVETDACSYAIRGQHGLGEAIEARDLDRLYISAIGAPAMRLRATMGKRGGWWVDQSCEATDLRVHAVLDGLLTLQLAGKVREGPPGAFQAVDAV